MKDEQIQKSLAKLMIGGVVLAALILLAGQIWFAEAHRTTLPGDHIFKGEPTYLENPISMIRHAFDEGVIGERRSVIMIGVVLLLINPLVRVAFSIVGFSAQKDRLYTFVSAFVFAVLLISFFW